MADIKFDGTATDWVRFWKQFEEEINKCKRYAAITKKAAVKPAKD